MKGFDPKYKDPPDYILGITREIWEDRGIKTLEHRYTEDIPVRSPSSVVVGNKAVIAATMATLAEFPDRVLLGEDVIWSGSAEEPEGFLSSHRLLSTATHQRDGIYGMATGTKLTYRIIADCACRNDQVYDEWLIRDQGAIVRQLGLDPRRYAADRIAAEGGPEHCARPFTPEADIAGPYTGRGNDNPAGARYADLLTRMMAADMAAVPNVYDRAAQIGPAGGSDRAWLGRRRPILAGPAVVIPRTPTSRSTIKSAAKIRASRRARLCAGAFGASMTEQGRSASRAVRRCT